MPEDAPVTSAARPAKGVSPILLRPALSRSASLNSCSFSRRPRPGKTTLFTQVRGRGFLGSPHQTPPQPRVGRGDLAQRGIIDRIYEPAGCVLGLFPYAQTGRS